MICLTLRDFARNLNAILNDHSRRSRKSGFRLFVTPRATRRNEATATLTSSGTQRENPAGAQSRLTNGGTSRRVEHRRDLRAAGIGRPRLIPGSLRYVFVGLSRGCQFAQSHVYVFLRGCKHHAAPDSPRHVATPKAPRPSPCPSVRRLSAPPRGKKPPARGPCGPEKAAAPVVISSTSCVAISSQERGDGRACEGRARPREPRHQHHAPLHPATYLLQRGTHK